MLKNEVRVGGIYRARIGGEFCNVRLDSVSLDHHGKSHGWHATNLRTGRAIIIKSATKLRCEVRPAQRELNMTYDESTNPSNGWHAPEVQD